MSRNLMYSNFCHVLSLSVSSYIEVEDTSPKTDIKELNERIRRIVARENELRAEIDKIVAELEEDEV